MVSIFQTHNKWFAAAVAVFIMAAEAVWAVGMVADGILVMVLGMVTDMVADGMQDPVGQVIGMGTDTAGIIIVHTTHGHHLAGRTGTRRIRWRP